MGMILVSTAETFLNIFCVWAAWLKPTNEAAVLHGCGDAFLSEKGWAGIMLSSCPALESTREGLASDWESQRFCCKIASAAELSCKIRCNVHEFARTKGAGEEASLALLEVESIML